MSIAGTHWQRMAAGTADVNIAQALDALWVYLASTWLPIIVLHVQ